MADPLLNAYVRVMRQPAARKQAQKGGEPFSRHLSEAGWADFRGL